MKQTMTKPVYPYTRIEKDARADFLARFDPEAEREEVLALAEQVSLKDGRRDEHRWYAEGFVRGLLDEGGSYRVDESAEHVNGDKHIQLGWINGYFTRREIR